MNCHVCSTKNTEFLNYTNYKLYYCPCCFHIQCQNFVKKNKNYNFQTNDEKIFLNDKIKKNIFLNSLHSKHFDILNISEISIDIEVNATEVNRNVTINNINEKNINDKISKKLKESYNSFDIIIDLNILDYSNNPNQILKNYEHLCNNETIIYINTKKSPLINFDFPRYHNQISFFNINSMKYLCSQNNLIVNNVYKENDNILFEISKMQKKDTNMIKELLNEIEYEIYDDEIYKKYNYYFTIYKNKFHNILLKHKFNNFQIIGYGNSLLSDILLNEFNDNSLIDHFINKTNETINDEMLLKCQLDNCKKTLFVIFDYMNYDEIVNRISNLNLPKYTYFFNIYPFQIIFFNHY